MATNDQSERTSADSVCFKVARNLPPLFEQISTRIDGTHFDGMNIGAATLTLSPNDPLGARRGNLQSRAGGTRVSTGIPPSNIFYISLPFSL
jgi:hypothetical protein